MANRGLQKKGIVRRNKMLYAAITLFLEKGYEKTTTAQIAKTAGMSQTSFFAAFENKEALLLELVRIMFSQQFGGAEKLIGTEKNPVLLYAVETALQMHITELSEPLRELYVAAYSLPTTSEYIYESTAEKLQKIFSGYLPGLEKSDFYEMDIASAGIMRGFMAKRCDLYFTMEQKLRRYLECSLKLYSVPKEVIRDVSDKICEMDLSQVAQKMIQTIVETASKGFWAVMHSEEVS